MLTKNDFSLTHIFLCNQTVENIKKTIFTQCFLSKQTKHTNRVEMIKIIHPT